MIGDFHQNSYAVPLEAFKTLLRRDGSSSAELDSLIEHGDEELLMAYLYDTFGDRLPPFELHYARDVDEKMVPGETYLVFDHGDMFYETPTSKAYELFNSGISPFRWSGWVNNGDKDERHGSIAM